MTAQEEIEKLMDVLDDELMHTYSVFKTYLNLYGGDADTKQLLKESDEALFGELYVVYLNYLSVAVARLLDPSKTGRKENLTFFRLLDLVDAHTGTAHQKLRDDLDTCKAKSYNFTEPRNQLVAHLDLDSNLTDRGRKAVPSFQAQEFDEFYSSVGAFMNELREVLAMNPFMYEWGVAGHGYGRKLLHRLKRADDAIHQRIEQGAAPNP